MTDDVLKQELAALGRKIAMHSDRLQDHDGVSERHAAEDTELKRRYQTLKAQVDDEVHDLETANHHVGTLERDFLNFVASIDYDYQHE